MKGHTQARSRPWAGHQAQADKADISLSHEERQKLELNSCSKKLGLTLHINLRQIGLTIVKTI